MSLEFRNPFDAIALQALGPMLALGVGMLVLLLVGALTHSRWARGAVVAASLLIAVLLQVALLLDPPGAVLDGTLLANRVSALWGLLILGATALTWLYSLDYYAEDRPFLLEHDALLLTAPIGMLLMVGAGDLLTFFIGLELLSVPLYALAAFRRNRGPSVEAGLKYFLLGAFAVAFFLYGSALIYTATGTIALERLRQVGLDNPLALSGIALLAASVFFKVSVFPFHLWVPDVYQGAPTPITALMATGTKAAAFAFLLNVAFLLPTSAATTIAVIALVTMALGNLGALVQTNLKRMLAWSSIAHAGTVLLVVAADRAGDPLRLGALHAALFYLGAYLFTAAGAFGLLSLLERDGETFPTLDSLRGLAQSRPWVAAALVLFMLSLAGMPLTGGFLGKYLVFYSAVRADLIAVAVVGVLLSVVALAYYLRVIVAMYMQPLSAERAAAALQRAPTALAAIVATWVCVAGVLAMGLLPGWFLDQLR
jgi:NADH-quinone oxidoreductase subunit N